MLATPWRGPHSLRVPRRDPSTGEVFPGSYRFNPYTGTERKAEPF